MGNEQTAAKDREARQARLDELRELGNQPSNPPKKMSTGKRPAGKTKREANWEDGKPKIL